MATSLVDNLRPAARDQVKYRDRVLRATVTSNEQSARGSSTILQWDMAGYAAFSLSFIGDSSQFAVEGSNDLTAWGLVDAQMLGASNAPVSMSGVYQENQALTGTVPVTSLAGNKQYRYMRVRGPATSARNSLVVATLTQTPFTPLRPTKHLGPDATWSYVAPASGLASTSSTALKAAGNTYHRNLLTSVQLANSGTTGTEVAILDGTTALWRHWLPPGAQLVKDFDPPLRAAPAAALNVQLSAVPTSGAVYANAQGLTALA